jgi:heme-degrading monooxygenase HmoA
MRPQGSNKTPGAVMHIIVWQYDVAAAHVATFERTYASGGAWAALFARAEGFLGTQLLADHDVPGRYVTFDRWRSPADFAAFERAFGDEYARLDATCEGLTLREERLGELVISSPGRSRAPAPGS